MKQTEIKYIAQGHKHAGRSRAQTHDIDGIVIMNPSLFSEIVYALCLVPVAGASVCLLEITLFVDKVKPHISCLFW